MPFNDTVPKGKLVYISGSTGENPLFKLVTNTDHGIASRTWGMTYESINSTAFGRVIHFGLIENLDTSAYTAGTELWLGVNGEFTNVRPALPTAQIYIGMVICSSATVGSIFIDLRTSDTSLRKNFSFTGDGVADSNGQAVIKYANDGVHVSNVVFEKDMETTSINKESVDKLINNDAINKEIERAKLS